MEKVIEVKNLTKKYKELTAIDNLSFDVKEGEILGLLGPNGSGKSTTINCILSLLNFNEGEIKIFNKKMNANSYDIKEKIGVIFQDVAVFEELRVYENIDYFCGLYIKNKAERKKKVEEAITFVGLNDYRKFYPKQLSRRIIKEIKYCLWNCSQPKTCLFR